MPARIFFGPEIHLWLKNPKKNLPETSENPAQKWFFGYFRGI